MKKFKLSLNNKFDFNKTISILQRGNDDPINRINQKTWTRVLTDKGDSGLFKIYHNKGLFVDKIDGTLSSEKAGYLVMKLLGFDDPLTDFDFLTISGLEKLESAKGFGIPGYINLFEALVQIIMGQQISVAVANKIRANFTQALGKYIIHDNLEYYSFPTIDRVLDTSVNQLNALGLSANKAKSVLEVAKFLTDNQNILNNDMTNVEEIREQLLTVYGVGNWTIDWILLRYFRKFEVIPSGDLAVQKALSWWFNKNDLITVAQLKVMEQELYPLGGALIYRILVAYSYYINQTKTI